MTNKTISPRTNAYKTAAASAVYGWHVQTPIGYGGYVGKSFTDIVEGMFSKFRLTYIGGNVLMFESNGSNIEDAKVSEYVPLTCINHDSADCDVCTVMDTLGRR